MILLDSHVVLWTVLDSPRLGRRTRTALTAADTVFVSAVTFAELRIKAMLGKLQLPAELARGIAEQGLEPLPLAAAHAEALSRFPMLSRHDPFDRLLLAQATVEGLQLATADAALLALDLDFVIDATR